MNCSSCSHPGPADNLLPFQNLLEKVIQKSEGYTVDQLERLYSVLSQCIYQHRGDYDKTLLTEVSRLALQAGSLAAADRGNLLLSLMCSQGSHTSYLIDLPQQKETEQGLSAPAPDEAELRACLHVCSAR